MINYSKYLLQLLLLLSPLALQAQYKLVLRGHWDNDSLEEKGGQTFNSLWGYTAPDGREYAIMGSLDSIYFFDITEPEKLKLVDVEAGRQKTCIHREFKTYQHYCYAVADEGRSSLQIFDLQYLPDSVHKVYDQDTVSTKAHNLFIDNDKLYLADNKLVKYIGNGIPVGEAFTLTVASLQDPLAPKILGHLEPPQDNSGYRFSEVHDLYVRNDTAYCSNGSGGLFIYNYQDPANPKLIQSIEPPYKDNGYNHSNWVSADGNIMAFTDETHGKRVKLYSISEIKSKPFPSLYQLSLFGEDWEKGSVAHNPFIKGTHLYLSYYHEGVVVYDIFDPEHPVEIGQYDTYPQDDTVSDPSRRYEGYQGCWNVYPFFPSGLIIASDMSNGLFVLSLDDNSGAAEAEVPDALAAVIAGNPVSGNEFTLITELPAAARLQISIMDLSGKQLWSGTRLAGQGRQAHTISPAVPLASGIYFVKLQSSGNSKTLKLIRQ